MRLANIAVKSTVFMFHVPKSVEIKVSQNRTGRKERLQHAKREGDLLRQRRTAASEF